MGKTQWLADFARSSWQTKVMRKMLDAEKYDALRHSFYEKSYGKPILDSATVNRQLREKLKNGEPFAVTRNGMWETGILAKIQRDIMWNKDTAAGMDDVFTDRRERVRYYNMTCELMQYAD